MRRSLLALVSVLALLLTVGVGHVAADPVKNPNITPGTVECSNGETLYLAGADNSASALVIGDTRVTILKELTLVDLVTGETVVHDTVGSGQKLGLEGDLVTCTNTFIDAETGHEIGLLAVIFITPRGN